MICELLSGKTRIGSRIQNRLDGSGYQAIFIDLIDSLNWGKTKFEIGLLLQENFTRLFRCCRIKKSTKLLQISPSIYYNLALQYSSQSEYLAGMVAPNWSTYSDSQVTIRFPIDSPQHQARNQTLQTGSQPRYHLIPLLNVRNSLYPH